MKSQVDIVVLSSSDLFFYELQAALPEEKFKLYRFISAKDIDEHGINPLAVFVDRSLIQQQRHSGLLDELADNGYYVILSLDEKNANDGSIQEIHNNRINDVLIFPIRPLELLIKMRYISYYSQLLEISVANKDLKILIQSIEEDLSTARSIQKALIPEKFKQVPGFKVMHKYLSGLKSGGDYLDFFEFEDNTHLGILMSDSSGYGLSAAFMSVILRLGMKLSKDEAYSPADTVSKIYDELKLTMKPKENLSIFYGVLNRKTFDLRYIQAGSVQWIHQSQNKHKFHDQTTEPLLKEGKFKLKDNQITLQPGDRFLVFSDGYYESFHKNHEFNDLINESYGKESIELINQMTYQVKKGIDPEEGMPRQDCSVMVIDVKKRAMRLAK